MSNTDPIRYRKGITVRLPEPYSSIVEGLAKSRGGKCKQTHIITELVIKSLDETNDKLVLTSLKNVNTKQNLLDRKVEFCANLFVFFLTSYFASHPEPLPENVENLKISSNKRADKFMTNFVEYLKSHGSSIQAFVADYVEGDTPDGK